MADRLTGTTPRFGGLDYTLARFSSKGADEAWVDVQMAGTPSRFYLKHNQ